MPMAKLDDVLRNENAIVVMTASAAVFTNTLELDTVDEPPVLATTVLPHHQLRNCKTSQLECTICRPRPHHLPQLMILRQN
jgi:hypothetical protein